jgi:uncharacterized tellurite resistance protein B-like protein
LPEAQRIDLLNTGLGVQKRYIYKIKLYPMPIIDLYKHSESRKNLAHFAAMASLAAVDGEINPQEKQILDRFAQKLGISKEEYKEVMKKENKYPIETPLSNEERMERLYDFFRIIFSDSTIESEQLGMVERYALGLGFPPVRVPEVVQRSIAIFSGKVSYDDYKTLMKK